MSGLNDFLKNFGDSKDDKNSEETISAEDKAIVNDTKAEENFVLNIKPTFKLDADVSLEKTEADIEEPIPVVKVEETTSKPVKHNSDKEFIEPSMPSLGAIKYQGEYKVSSSPKKRFEDYLDEEIDYLFDISETHSRDKDRWVNYMKEAFASKKNNVVVRKLRSGRFRIEDDQITILPQFNTKDMSANDLLSNKW